VTDLLGEVERALRGDEGVRALFVTGSHAAGREDEHSDLDLLAVIDGALPHEVAARVMEVVDELDQVVDTASRPLGQSLLVNLITRSCRRIDLVVTGADIVPTTPRFGPARPLFDRDDIQSRLPTVSAAPQPTHDAGWFDSVVRGALRTSSLLPMLIAREEFIRGAAHAQLLKQDLIELLLFSGGDPPLSRPGLWAWSDLNRRLSPDHRRQVEDLPAPGTGREDVIAAHVATLRALLALARDVASARGFEWRYDAFEQAVYDHLERHDCLG
jgi:predicted nucleotidyltransferase